MHWPVLALSSLAFMLLALSCGSGGRTGQYQLEEDAEYWLFVEEDKTCSVARWVRDSDTAIRRVENSGLLGWSSTSGSFSTVSTGRFDINGPEVTLSCLGSLTAKPSVDAKLDGKTLTTEDGQRWVRR